MLSGSYLDKLANLYSMETGFCFLYFYEDQINPRLIIIFIIYLGNTLGSKKIHKLDLAWKLSIGKFQPNRYHIFEASIMY